MLKKQLTLFLSLFLFCSQATAALDIQLVARSGEFDGLHLPAPSLLFNSSPAIDSRGNVAFTYLGLSDETGKYHRKLFHVSSEGVANNVHTAKGENMLSAPSFSSTGEVLFAEFNQAQTLQILKWSPVSHESQEALDLSDYSDTLSFSDLSFVYGDELLWRNLNYYGERSFQTTLNGLNILAQEGSDEKSYLFTPQASGAFVAAKVRKGEQGDWADSRPDEILRWQLPLKEPKVIAQDRDAEKGSSFISFGNSLGLSDQGDVVFVAEVKGKEGAKAIYLSDKGEFSQLAIEGKNGVQELETFQPLVNNKKTVVFRAIDDQNRRSLYSWRPETGLVRLIGEGDIVPSDRETLRIVFSDWGPGLAGSPALNNSDEIVFQAALEQKNGEKIVGSGIYKIKL